MKTCSDAHIINQKREVEQGFKNAHEKKARKQKSEQAHLSSTDFTQTTLINMAAHHTFFGVSLSKDSNSREIEFDRLNLNRVIGHMCWERVKI